MFINYGISRVVEPGNVLPISAWRLDNSSEIRPDELLLNIKRLHIETSNFKQLCAECNNDAEKIKERITDIVQKRGKLHNPVTDTGGVVFGIIEKIGEQYENEKELSAGDEVICNISIVAIPLYISRITKIDFALGQIEAEGYAVIFNHCPIVKKPQDIPIPMLLLAFNESGSLCSVGRYARKGKNFLVVGSSMVTSLFYGYVIRQAAGKNARIVCIIDDKADCILKGPGTELIFSQVFNEVHYLDILKPIECLAQIASQELFELSVNCADIPGAETINVLATKSAGVVYFTNLINNYNIALYITEAISREIEIKCADGYVEKYDDFSIEVVRKISEYIKGELEELPGGEEKELRSHSHSNKLYHNRKSMADDFVCESRAMSLVLDKVLEVAKYDCNVMIIGETGVGKEKIASLIHKNSGRKLQPLVKINCASVAENLLESEFFGYEKGAFTGASKEGKLGLFEIADEGTLFLDEIGELPLDMQVKLLRVLQDNEFQRVGGVKPIRTDVRIIAATNRNLQEMVEKKTFREDLYYRLNIVPINIPPLRERQDDIIPLINYFLCRLNKKYGFKKTLSSEAMNCMFKYEWRGNVRELKNIVERVMVMSNGDNISAKDLPEEIKTWGDEHHILLENDVVPLKTALDKVEKHLLKVAFDKYGNVRDAARALEIDPATFVRKRRKHDRTGE